MKQLKLAFFMGSLFLGACAPVNKADALPRKTRLQYSMKNGGQDSARRRSGPSQKIVSGKTTYELLGNHLVVMTEKDSKVISLEETFRGAGLDPARTTMQVDGFPKKMNIKGNLLFAYSPGANGIALINPNTGESTYIKVSREARPPGRVAFRAKNGIVALSGPGADFILIIGLGDLLNKEFYPVKMRLDNVFSRGRRHLIDPKLEIKGERVYISDESFGKGKTYSYQVHDGIALPINIESD